MHGLFVLVSTLGIDTSNDSFAQVPTCLPFACLVNSCVAYTVTHNYIAHEQVSLTPFTAPKYFRPVPIKPLSERSLADNQAAVDGDPVPPAGATHGTHLRADGRRLVLEGDPMRMEPLRAGVAMNCFELADEGPKVRDEEWFNRKCKAPHHITSTLPTPPMIHTRTCARWECVLAMMSILNA